MKFRLLNRYGQNAVLIAFIFIPLQCFSKGINISDVEIWSDENQHYISAKVNCVFSDESIEALHHGVALQILVDIKTKLKRSLLWDKTLNASTVTYRIEFHPLSKRYVLTNLNHYQRKDFQNLGNALEELGMIEQWPLIHQRELMEGNQYQVFIRAKLDIEALPAPLRPLALISNHWRLNSEWHKWDLPI